MRYLLFNIPCMPQHLMYFSAATLNPGVNCCSLVLMKNDEKRKRTTEKTKHNKQKVCDSEHKIWLRTFSLSAVYHLIDWLNGEPAFPGKRQFDNSDNKLIGNKINGRIWRIPIRDRGMGPR